MTETTRKPRRKLTLADRLAVLGAKINANVAQIEKWKGERQALIEAEKERVAAALAAIEKATKG